MIDRWPPNASSCRDEMRLAAYRTKNRGTETKGPSLNRPQSISSRIGVWSCREPELIISDFFTLSLIRSLTRK